MLQLCGQLNGYMPMSSKGFRNISKTLQNNCFSCFVSSFVSRVRTCVWNHSVLCQFYFTFVQTAFNKQHTKTFIQVITLDKKLKCSLKAAQIMC